MTSTVSWTGGTPPRPYNQIQGEEKEICDRLLKEKCDMYEAYWGEPPCEEIRREYLVHARYDAWATVREKTRQS